MISYQQNTSIFHHYYFSIKSANRVLKQQLKFLTNDLKLIIENIEMFFMNQRKKYAFKLNVVEMQMSFDLQIFLFRDFISKIISYVLRIIYNQFKLLNIFDFNFPCTHSWNKMTKLFCNHFIKKKLIVFEEML